ncbi:MAG: hypothetical protein M3Y41_17625 [Pseudomonadota bacterium]|nr:hypothetical protein [Pseudomonadota bacterium]
MGDDEIYGWWNYYVQHGGHDAKGNPVPLLDWTPTVVGGSAGEQAATAAMIQTINRNRTH